MVVCQITVSTKLVFVSIKPQSSNLLMHVHILYMYTNVTKHDIVEYLQNVNNRKETKNIV